MGDEEEESYIAMEQTEDTEKNEGKPTSDAPQRPTATEQHKNGSKKRPLEGLNGGQCPSEKVDDKLSATSKRDNEESAEGRVETKEENDSDNEDEDDRNICSSGKKARLSAGSINTHQEIFASDNKEEEKSPVEKKGRISTGSTNTYMEMSVSEEDASPAGEKARISSGSTNTDLEMFGDEDENGETDGVASELSQKKETPEAPPPLQQRQLSKFAARLLDPNRQRGLVEPPQTIPLNDEFLQAFGRRERQHDEKIGRQLDVDTANLDDKDDEDANASDDEEQDTNRAGKRAKVGVKVKLSNLNYATTKLTITRRCEEFGPLLSVNLVLDSKTSRSIGRAFVTFDLMEDAQKCVAAMNDKPLEGRAVRMVICSNDASSSSERSSRRGGGSESAGLANLFRYWERDLSTKCRRCGQVGHIAAQCPNEDNSQDACPLCGGYDHDTSTLRQCPYSTFCFNCGAPGHVNRECPHRRSLPRRIVCGYCCQSGHHRWSCPEITTGWRSKSDVLKNASQHAKCFVCGEVGHYMCGTGMKWFFDLPGEVFCFNCGMEGHHGSRCDRPNLEACSRDFEVVQKEIDRAEAASIDLEMRLQRNKSRGSNNNSRVSRSSSYSERGHSKPSNDYDKDRESRGRQRSDGRNTSRDEYLRTSSLPPSRGTYSRQPSREYYNDAPAPLQRGRSRSDNSTSTRHSESNGRSRSASNQSRRQTSQRGYR